MENIFELSWKSASEIVITAVCVYAGVILLTRIFGKRSFSKMSSFDFPMTVAVGSIIASTIMSPSITLVSGIIGLGAVYMLQLTVALARKSKYVRKVVDNTPLLLMDGEKVLYDNLKKARVTEGDLRSKLREANVLQLSDVKAVIFETTGDISVLHDGDQQPLDLWLLSDVRRE